MIFKICQRQHRYQSGQGCPECKKLKSRIWKQQHSEHRKLQGQNWYHLNKMKRKADMAKWKSLNLDKCSAIAAKRRAAKLNATPKWLTEEQKKSINLYYKVAKWIESILDEKIHVDHIVPLQGVNYSGLHVPWNLQLLSSSDNFKKHNKL